MQCWGFHTFLFPFTSEFHVTDAPFSNCVQTSLKTSFRKVFTNMCLWLNWIQWWPTSRYSWLVYRISKWDKSQNYTYCQYVRICMVYAHSHACIPPIFCDRATTSFRICFVDVWNVTSEWTPERSLDRATLWPWCLQWSIIRLFGSKIQESIQSWQQLCEASAVLWTIASLPLYILINMQSCWSLAHMSVLFIMFV